MLHTLWLTYRASFIGLLAASAACTSTQQVNVRSRVPDARLSARYLNEDSVHRGEPIRDRALPASIELEHPSSSTPFFVVAGVSGGIALIGGIAAAVGAAGADDEEQSVGADRVLGTIGLIGGGAVAGLALLLGVLQAVQARSDVELTVDAPGFTATSTVIQLPLETPDLRLDPGTVGLDG